MSRDMNFSATASGTTSATATQAAATNRRHVCTHISGYTDADSLVQILDGDDTVLWETKIEQDLTGQGFQIGIPDGIEAPAGKAIKGKVATGSAACRVNISGYTKP